MERNCRNCGAPLDHNKSFCEYCGTPTNSYLIKPPTITITPHNLQTLKCEVAIGREMVDRVEGIGYAKEIIARKLADGLMDFIDIKVSNYDPIIDGYMVSGRIRVLNESARFM